MNVHQTSKYVRTNMKKLIVFIVAMMAIQLHAQHHDWEDPSVLG